MINYNYKSVKESKNEKGTNFGTRIKKCYTQA